MLYVYTALILVALIATLVARAEARQNAIGAYRDHLLIMWWLWGAIACSLASTFITITTQNQDNTVSPLAAAPSAFLVASLGVYTTVDHYLNKPRYQTRVRNQQANKQNRRRRIGTPSTRAARPAPRVRR